MLAPHEKLLTLHLLFPRRLFQMLRSQIEICYVMHHLLCIADTRSPQMKSCPAKKSWAVGPWWWSSWKGSNLMPKNRDKTANNYVYLTVKVKIWAYTITLTFNSEFLLRFGLLQVMILLAIPKSLVSMGFKYERLLT